MAHLTIRKHVVFASVLGILAVLLSPYSPASQAARVRLGVEKDEFAIGHIIRGIRADGPSGERLAAKAASSSSRVRVTRKGEVILRNRREAIRGLELTLKVKDGAQITGARAVGRAAGFSTDFHQQPDGTVKVILFSLDGRTIREGRGTVVELDVSPSRQTKLRLIEAKIAKQ